MSGTLEVVAATSTEWPSWLQRSLHDFHHTAAHHLIWQAAGGGRAWLAVFGSSRRFLAWPFLVRGIETATAGEMLYDVTSVDGYAGPVAYGCSPRDTFTNTACQAIFDYWRRSGYISVFSRFHPLLRNHLWVEGDHDCPVTDSVSGSPRDFSSLRHEGHTVSIDLRQQDADAFGEYRTTHRRHIHRARRLGLTWQIDNSEAALKEFIRLYHLTMRKNRAREHYFFSQEFVQNLCNCLDGGASIHQACLNGRTVAAVLITEYSGIVQYLLGGVDPDLYEISPLKLLLEEVRRWARRRGNHTLHLGGGRGGRDDDPLFYFKAGFSDRRHCYFTGRWVLDQERYDRLVAERRQQAERLGCPSIDLGFFPAYRAPIEHLDATASLDPVCAN